MLKASLSFRPGGFPRTVPKVMPRTNRNQTKQYPSPPFAPGTECVDPKELRPGGSKWKEGITLTGTQAKPSQLQAPEVLRGHKVRPNSVVRCQYSGLQGLEAHRLTFTRTEPNDYFPLKNAESSI